jgi:hypothetical protein
MRPRLTITLAFLVAGLLIAALPRSGTAAPVPGTSHAPGTSLAPATSVPQGTTSAGRSASIAAEAAAQDSRNACSLTGLVPAPGSHCPDSGRLRRQAWGIPPIADPLPIVKRVVGGGIGSAIKSVALAAILGWVASGAESALKETANVIDDTTSPQLTSSWFSASYWRIAGIAALLTLPFLCAAAIHALVRSDLGLLARAALGYLPLSLLAVGIASQLTMLLLAGTDQMASIVASASLHADSVFLSTTSVRAIAESVATQDPFVTFLAAIITVGATLALWLELLVRDAAVYVIVLMLPLFFAAMVWPARRTLTIRAIETLIALILSKFAIVAVLSLGGAALGHSTSPSAASVLTGGTLVLLAAFTPWALLRMLPLHEVASAAAGGLSHAPKHALSSAADTALKLGDGMALLGGEWSGRKALPDGKPSILGSGAGTERRSVRDPGLEREPEPGWAEPVDADVAEPVAIARSGSAQAGDEAGAAAAAAGAGSVPGGAPGTATGTGSAPDGAPATAVGAGSVPGVAPVTATGTGSAPDGLPGPELAARRTNEAPDSNAGDPAAEADFAPRWPGGLAFPGADGDADPVLPLGSDMLALADERRLPPAGAHEDSDDPPTPSVPGPDVGLNEFGGDV